MIIEDTAQPRERLRASSRREMVSRLYVIHKIFAGEQNSDDEAVIRELAKGLEISEEELANMIEHRGVVTGSLNGFFGKLFREGDQILSLASDDLVPRSNSFLSYVCRSAPTKVDWALIPSHIERVPGMSYYQEAKFGPDWDRYLGFFVGFKPDKRYSILIGKDGDYEEIYSEEIDLLSHTFLTQLLDFSARAASSKGKISSLGCDVIQYRSFLEGEHRYGVSPDVGYISPDQVLYHYPKELFCHMIKNSNEPSITRWFHKTFYHCRGYERNSQRWTFPPSNQTTEWGTIFPGDPEDIISDCKTLEESPELTRAHTERRHRAVASIAPLLLEKIVYTLKTLRTEKHPRYRTDPPYCSDPVEGWFGIDPEIDAFLITPVFTKRILDNYVAKPSLSDMYKFLTIYRLQRPDRGSPHMSYLNRVYVETFLKNVLEKGTDEEYQLYLDTYREMIKLYPTHRFGLDFRYIYETLHKRSFSNPLREEFVPIHRMVVESVMEFGGSEELIQRLEELV